MRQFDQSRPASVADLYDVPGKAELVNGNLVRMPPTGGKPSAAATEILVSLRDHARLSRTGQSIGDNTGFLVDLHNRRSFSPDAAFWIGKPPSMKFYEGAPIFAVEVRSENDHGNAAEMAMATKRADYFAAGTLVFWDIDLQANEVVRSYRFDSPNVPRIFGRGSAADAEPAVRGWSIAVNDLLPFD